MCPLMREYFVQSWCSKVSVCPLLRKCLLQAEGFIALPGGVGTMEELTEMLTWYKLDLHQKPIGLLNVDRYYDHFISLVS